MRKILLATSVLISAAFLLVGCSYNPDKSIGVPNDLGYVFPKMDSTMVAKYQNEYPDFSPSAFFVDKNSLDVILYGSSSCPPTIESVYDESNTVRINLKEWGDIACTADYGPSGYSVKALKAGFTFKDKAIMVCDANNCSALPVR